MMTQKAPESPEHRAGFRNTTLAANVVGCSQATSVRVILRRSGTSLAAVVARGSRSAIGGARLATSSCVVAVEVLSLVDTWSTI